VVAVRGGEAPGSLSGGTVLRFDALAKFWVLAVFVLRVHGIVRLFTRMAEFRAEMALGAILMVGMVPGKG
jgi:hypothetical protein